MFSRRTTTLEDAHRIDRWCDALALLLASVASSTTLSAIDPRAALAEFGLAVLLWWAAARVLRQYDASNGRGLLGDVALTLVMLATIIGPTWLLSALGAPCLRIDAGRFAGTLTLAVLVTRLWIVGRKLPPVRVVADVLVAGIGPLGQLTAASMRADPTRRV